MVAFGLGLAIALGLVVGLSVLLTGHEIAYLGVSRGGVKVENPQHVPIQAVAERVKAASATQIRKHSSESICDQRALSQNM